MTMPELTSPFPREDTTGQVVARQIIVSALSEGPELQLIKGVGDENDATQPYPVYRAGYEDFPTYELHHPGFPSGWKARVYHGTHPRNVVANKIEVDDMVRLGDEREASEKEFVPYFGSSFVIELIDTSDDEERTLGMMRITPHTLEKGTKTVNDIAQITEEDASLILAEFMDESGCEDINKVWDITTLALTQERRKGETIKIVKSLLSALVDIGFADLQEGKLTHVICAVEPRMLAVLYDFGYPMKDLNGYGDMNYDLNHSGRAMVCHPAYFAVADLAAKLREPDTTHLTVSRFALRHLVSA